MQCATCGQASRYVCPVCATRSCSAACVAAHKRQTRCTGTHDPTTFVPKQQLLTAAGIDRDYNFLQRISRDIAVHRSDAGRTRVSKPRDTFRAGVRVRAMGRGMSRVAKNRSRWNAERKSFEWTVEFVLGRERRLAQVLDSTPVGQLAEAAGASGAHRAYLRDVNGSRQLLDTNLSLKDALKGRMVLEFPTIELAVEASDSDSDSDSDSESSDGSDSSDDSDNGSSDVEGGDGDGNAEKSDPSERALADPPTAESSGANADHPHGPGSSVSLHGSDAVPREQEPADPPTADSSGVDADRPHSPDSGVPFHGPQDAALRDAPAAPAAPSGTLHTDGHGAAASERVLPADAPDAAQDGPKTSESSCTLHTLHAGDSDSAPEEEPAK